MVKQDFPPRVWEGWVLAKLIFLKFFLFLDFPYKSISSSSARLKSWLCIQGHHPHSQRCFRENFTKHSRNLFSITFFSSYWLAEEVPESWPTKLSWEWRKCLNSECLLDSFRVLGLFFGRKYKISGNIWNLLFECMLFRHFKSYLISPREHNYLVWQ